MNFALKKSTTTRYQVDFSVALEALGPLDEAEASCRQASEINPDFHSAHWNLALQLLPIGSFANAWPHHEFRYSLEMRGKPVSVAPDLPFPQWGGESLAGKSGPSKA